jgi:hypothetical protein
MALAGGKIWCDSDSVTFPAWQEALACASLPDLVKWAHQQEIFTFLRRCKQSHSPASVTAIRQYLASLPPNKKPAATTALRQLVSDRPQAGGWMIACRQAPTF